MANIMRFVILGDDRGGPAFAQFAKQVEKANAAVDRNNAALKRQGAAAKEADRGIAGLVGSVTGFGDVAGAASSEGSTFQRVLAGINVATGILEPALAGVVVAAGGMAAAFTAAAAGAAAYQVALRPLLSQTSDVMKAQESLDKARAKAQADYTAAIKSGTGAQAAGAARTKAMAAAQQQYNLAVAGTPKPVREFAAQVTAAKSTWTAWADSLARPVLGPLSTGLKLVGPALKAITPLVRVTAGAFGTLMAELARKVSAGGLTSVVSTLLPHVRTSILDLGHAAGNVAAGIWGILKAFMPVSGQITGGVVRLTALFKTWAQSLPQHTGFQSLMATFREQTPLAVQVLKNLATVLANVGRAMTGLATGANSKALLQALIPLSGVLASLSKNTALDRIVLYMIAAKQAANQLRPAFLGVRAAVAFFPAAAAAVTAFAGVTEGATVAQTLAAAATRAWGIAMAALPWVALAAAVVAVAALIIKYHAQIWNFLKKVWADILGVIMAVWHWIQRNWPLLLAIITGPVGLAIRWIVQNFGAITGAVRTVLNAISIAWNATWNTLKTAFRLLVVDWILTPLGWIVHAAATAFGWIPGLGGKLRTAAKAFDQFKNDVNRALGGVNGRTIDVSVKLTPVGAGPYAGKPLAAGGRVTGPGGPRDDRAGLYALSNGEWVIRADSAARYGLAAMHAVNRGTAVIGYASGGGVGVKATAPSYKTIEASLLASVTKLAQAFAKAAAAVSGSFGPGSGALGGDPGVNKALARKMFPWPASMWAAYDYLEMREAGYNRFARNPSSGAYGIPQALPPTKMPFAAQAAGGSHAGPQISWMYGYIRQRYGTPVNAAAHERSYNWYGGGLDAVISRPTLIGVGERGAEHVTVTPGSGDDIKALLERIHWAIRGLTDVAAAIPARTGQHVAGAVSGVGADAAFRRRYPGR